MFIYSSIFTNVEVAQFEQNMNAKMQSSKAA